MKPVTETDLIKITEQLNSLAELKAKVTRLEHLEMEVVALRGRARTSSRGIA